MTRVTVSIYTQVYNTKPFLSQCIESVLKQTYRDFEYFLIDNGSTDGSKEILERYAAQDSRVRLIRFEKNRVSAIWMQIARETSAGKYIAVLDSDDWLDPVFFDRLVSLAEQNRLGIVCTGTAFHAEGEKNISSGSRSIPQQIIMGKMEYAAYFPYYHVFLEQHGEN